MTEEILNVEVVSIPGKKSPEVIITQNQQSNRTDNIYIVQLGKWTKCVWIPKSAMLKVNHIFYL